MCHHWNNCVGDNMNSVLHDELIREIIINDYGGNVSAFFKKVKLVNGSKNPLINFPKKWQPPFPVELKL